MLTPREALVTLNLIPGLGSVRIRALLDFFGSAELVLAAPATLLSQVPRVGGTLAAAIADWRNCTNAAAELEAADRFGCRVVTLLDDDYPAPLRQVDDPPVVLYVRGEYEERDFHRAVAIVGTRMVTPYGMTAARRFGRELADAGHTVISGLARGIDTAGHWGALDAGGRTLAVLGFGMAGIYPEENAELADRICQGNGALISEFPMFVRPSRTTFPRRNRIVAAWAEATLVAEAPSHSGAMHTAKLAAEYGRSVFAVPGAITSPASAGCHDLIRDGATLCANPQQLIQDMGWDGTPRQLELFTPEAREADATEPLPAKPALPELPPASAEAALVDAVQRGHETLDALCSALAKGAHEINPLLMRLQIQGYLLPLPGGRYRLR